MATPIYTIERLARQRLNEIAPRFWSSDEMTSFIVSGIKDLWRDIADLKQEHFLTIDTTNVSLPASTGTLSGVPADVHKVYLIEPRDVTVNSSNTNLVFMPAEYNDNRVRAARTNSAVDPSNGLIYYSITSQGSPVGAPVIYCAPMVTSAVNLTFSYVPTLPTLTTASNVPIPGEVDNALVAWTVAYARAKERADFSPDPAWLQIYATEKAHILESLGLRQYQEPQFVEALFESEW